VVFRSNFHSYKFSAFSSVAAPLQPIVDRQAYILPGMIESMKETITEKGITSKHILGEWYIAGL
jgi:hypothetical protein